MLLQTQKLTKHFQRQGQAFPVLDQVDFSLEAGEVAVLTGPSGCGKSTFFNLLCGILTPDSGRILFQERELTLLQPADRTRLRGQAMAYVRQGAGLLDNLTVLDNLILPAVLSRAVDHPETLRQKGLERLECIGLLSMRDAYPQELSFGEQKRVAVIRALICEPRLVIADEPTSDLDHENAQIISNLFKEQAARGCAILLSTHQLDTVDPAFTHYHMRAGKIEPVS